MKKKVRILGNIGAGGDNRDFESGGGTLTVVIDPLNSCAGICSKLK